MIVGITGQINSGKDTIADILQENYNAVKMSFADPLKSYILQIFPETVTREALWGPSEKRTPEVRKLLQTFGTDVARAHDEQVWVRHTLRRISWFRQTGKDSLGLFDTTHSNRPIVIPDVRFLNEAAMVTEMCGGELVRLLRPLSYDLVQAELGTRNHPSETEMQQIPDASLFDTIINDGTLDELKTKIHDVIHRIIKEPDRDTFLAASRPTPR